MSLIGYALMNGLATDVPCEAVHVGESHDFTNDYSLARTPMPRKAPRGPAEVVKVASVWI